VSLAKAYLKLCPISPCTGCVSKLFNPDPSIALRKYIDDIDILLFSKLRGYLQASERQIPRQAAIVLICGKSASLFLSYCVVVNLCAAS
jgi:hypothetical protein